MILLKQLLYAAGFALLTLAIACAANVMHALFLSTEVVLYDGLEDVAAVAFLVLAALFISKRAAPSFEAVSGVLIGGLVAVIIVILIPTVVDRSFSIWILEKLAQRGGGIRHDAWNGIVVNEFMP